MRQRLTGAPLRLIGYIIKEARCEAEFLRSEELTLSEFFTSKKFVLASSSLTGVYNSRFHIILQVGLYGPAGWVPDEWLEFESDVLDPTTEVFATCQPRLERGRLNQAPRYWPPTPLARGLISFAAFKSGLACGKDHM